jgi:tryptophan synthase alpha chain
MTILPGGRTHHVETYRRIWYNANILMTPKTTIAVPEGSATVLRHCTGQSVPVAHGPSEPSPGRVRSVFSRHGKQVIPFVTAGFPSVRATTDAVRALVDEGVRLVEIGIPFSDPVADGPTIQHTSYEALRRGMTPARALELADSLRDTGVTIIVMTYLNPVVAYGTEHFLCEAAHAGVGGIIVSDVIPEESAALRALTSSYGIDTIFLVSPVTERRRRLAVYRASSGFVYLVTVTGTTGARTALPPEFVRFARTVRRETRQPVCAGFGISRLEHVRGALHHLDGFIIGSALADIMRTEVGTARLQRLRTFIRPFVHLCSSQGTPR